ncbi:hypothetical protein NDA13_002105 [Ustilago tritici]|nr:hypothetical protein NDA13_002105 [Ustilago tritici]
MPAKIPFFQPSDSLKQKWLEATNPTRISAQLYVFSLLIAIGLLRHYLSPRLPKLLPSQTTHLVRQSHQPNPEQKTNLWER